MDRTTTVLHQHRALPLPRGWILGGAAVASWALLAALWLGMSQLFQLVLAAL